jgi:putative ABC transport system ATP-binding protein
MRQNTVVATSNGTPLLEGRQLRRAYRLGATRVEALAGVDLRIERGDFVVLEGPSGSGKTTLINLLGLLDRPDGGTLSLDGRSVEGMDEDARADTRRDRYGFVFQSFNLVPVLTALENVAYPMALRGMSRGGQDEKARRLLGSVGLAGKEGMRPDLLSGGERQRVAIARAVANDPEVVLADEPTASLDTGNADSVLGILQDLNREKGVAVVVATHDPRVVARAKRVVTLRDGRIAGER